MRWPADGESRQTAWWTGPLMNWQRGICQWCGKSLRGCHGPRGQWAVMVDHDHGCRLHDATRSACSRCVRGLVHRRCNRDIAACERLVEASGVVDEHKMAYLRLRPMLGREAA